MSNTDAQKTPDTSSTADGRVSSGTLLATPRTDAAVLEASHYYQPLYPSINGRNQPVHATFAREIERENTRLRSAIGQAITYANGRESEWGERAQGAFDILHAALANAEMRNAHKSGEKQ